MSVGCLAASRTTDYIRWVLPLMLITVTLAGLTLWSYQKFGRLMVEVGGQQSPQLIFFGTEFRPRDPSHFVIPIEVIAGIFFTLITCIFLGLGQEMGRAFDALSDRIAAYTTNISGSLAGIVVFGLGSYLRLSPVVWYMTTIALLMICLWKYLEARQGWKIIQAGFGILTILAVSWTASSWDKTNQTFWSSYYKVQYSAPTGLINTNNISHQQMVPIGEAGPAYVLPHLLNRDAGTKAFQDVLIIGAGSGNDVQAALSHGARHVDAVEIDPLLYELGRDHHPDHPYADSRVHVHFDDGRNFLQKTDRQYDLIIYALVDSLVLHSSYSSIRLESFLFTRQAFEQIKSRLKPNGVFAMYNYYRQGWVVGRLTEMAQQVFDSEPLVVSMPYQASITPQDNQANHITFLLVGRTPDRLEPIKTKLHESDFWVHRQPSHNEKINAFRTTPPSDPHTHQEDWQKISPARVNRSGIEIVPTDDWPFLYLKDRMIPSLNSRGMLLIAGLSFAILLLFAPIRKIRPNGQMFFLGAGFMLLETKSVVHMALLFGSTWIVNSVVFFAILVMILGSNLYVLKMKPQNSRIFYACLVAALLANTVIPMSGFLNFNILLRTVISCTVVMIPIFFAGVVFAMAFQKSDAPGIDLGSNIGGIILGGLSEYFSLILGFNHLLIVAIGFYVVSLLLTHRVAD